MQLDTRHIDRRKKVALHSDWQDASRVSQEVKPFFQSAYKGKYPLSLTLGDDRRPLSYFGLRNDQGILLAACAVEGYSTVNTATKRQGVHIAISRFIANPEHPRQGHGTTLLRELIASIHKDFQNKEILFTANVLSTNEQSLRIFNDLGFETTCIQKKTRLDYRPGAVPNTYVDSIQLLLSNTPALEGLISAHASMIAIPSRNYVSPFKGTAFVRASNVSELDQAIQTCQDYLDMNTIPAILCPIGQSRKFKTHASENNLCPNSNLMKEGTIIHRGQGYDVLAYTRTTPPTPQITFQTHTLDFHATRASA